jgi:preprotein translocase subunit Sec63
VFILDCNEYIVLDEKDHARRCFCDGCDDKWRRKQATKPWNNVKRYTSRIILFIGWIGFAILVYRITLIKVDHQEYNPYAILGLDVVCMDDI